MSPPYPFLVFCSKIISSDRSSCSDDGLVYISGSWQRPLFQIFTQSIDAIDVTSVTQSCLNSINAIYVTRYWLMLIECRKFNCSNVPMFQCSNVHCSKVPIFKCSMFQCFNVQMFKCSIFNCSNVQMYKCSNFQIIKFWFLQMFKYSKVQMSNVK